MIGPLLVLLILVGGLTYLFVNLTEEDTDPDE